MQYDTAGNPIIFYDMCGYCNMTTGGQHEPHCPCFEPLQRRETYAEFGERLKREIEEHPEWGWQLI